MKEFYKRTMKVEMAPLAKAYTVDIKDTYTELSLEKIENQPTGPEGKRLGDYKELFESIDVQGTSSCISTPNSTEKCDVFPDSTGQATYDNKPIAISQIRDKEAKKCSFDEKIENLYERKKCTRAEARSYNDDIITEEVKVGDVNIGNVGESGDTVTTK